MAHVLRAHHVHDFFGEVLDVVADALEVAAHRRQRQHARHRRRVGRDVREQLGEQARVELVDLDVGDDHRGRAVGVARDEAVERRAQVLLHERRRAGRDRRAAPAPATRLSSSARFAMPAARSPMRSRSVTNLSAIVMKRRSLATGWRVARICSASSSISFSSRSIATSFSITLLRELVVAVGERLHRERDLLLRNVRPSRTAARATCAARSRSLCWCGRHHDAIRA